MKGVVVDSSALVAMVFEEADAPEILDVLSRAEIRRMGSLSLLETHLVVASRKGPVGQTMLDALVARLKIEVVALDEDQVWAARDAWLRFGQGRHPASLNIGDCCSYALARVSGLPLLAKGDDFPRTDLELVG